MTEERWTIFICPECGIQILETYEGLHQHGGEPVMVGEEIEVVPAADYDRALAALERLVENVEKLSVSDGHQLWRKRMLNEARSLLDSTARNRLE